MPADRHLTRLIRLEHEFTKVSQKPLQHNLAETQKVCRLPLEFGRARLP
jgi:hypothetical protein